MSVADDIKLSREREIALYTQEMPNLYEYAVSQNGTLYDLCFASTKGFTRVTRESILADSRIIKVLRYSISPPISQMKFGQKFGYATSSSIEKSSLRRGSSSYPKLSAVAGQMALFFSNHLDRSRFIWIDNPSDGIPLAFEYAKKWTCSLIANQNSETDYRHLRKRRQEDTISSFLEEKGYFLSSFTSRLESPDDLEIGSYCREIRIKGRTVQKADVVFRCKHSGRLCLVEAKAVGVLIDAAKRVKECCDKSNEWNGAINLGDCTVFAVIAGLFSEVNLAALEASNIKVVWEHRIEDLLGFNECLDT